MQTIKSDICVIGAGSAGLSVASGAAQLGRRTVLIEQSDMGGDCLNTGCVPSKALLAAAAVAQTMRESGRFGIAPSEPQIDGAAAHRHVRDVIARIEPNDSQARFEGLGCTVIRAHARFVDARTVEAGGTRIHARRFVIATGSRASVPPLPGLGDIPYFTNETIFDKDFIPAHLLVIGGGPIGCELAQAHRRLGSAVTIVEGLRILPRDDEAAAAVVREALLQEGVAIHEAAQVTSLKPAEDGIEAHIVTAQGSAVVRASHVLMATGRKANVDGLGLEQAHVAFDSKGIKVDAGLRTTNRHIYAIGDVAGGPQFTHVAGYHAGLVIRSALFRLPAKTDYRALPWVTYTDPELAQVGLTEAQARAVDPNTRTVTAEFAENDRAVTSRQGRGFVKLVLGRRGALLGATIVGPHAGELIGFAALAIAQRTKLSALAGLVLPYPTLSEALKRAAGAYYTPSLFSGRTRLLVRLLSWFG
jgi:pyruvate/2-oxoglutarate dehydrogenase complex dihydrolipoamide dehydrogenase (E3) component